MDDDMFIVYGRKSCPYCVMAVNSLTKKKLEHKFFDCEFDRDFLHEAKMFYNKSTVPIILHIPSSTNIARLVGGCDDLMEFLSNA